MYAGAARPGAAAAVLAYAPLARHLIDRCPIDIADRRVLDAGSGTGVAADVLAARGVRVVACDIEMDMLRAMTSRHTSVLSDVYALPFRGDAFDMCVAAFVLNHLPDPALALREMHRVTTSGGAILASVFSTERPRAKSAIDDVLASYGWRAPRCTTSCSGTRRPLGRWNGCGAWPNLPASTASRSTRKSSTSVSTNRR